MSSSATLSFVAEIVEFFRDTKFTKKHQSARLFAGGVFSKLLIFDISDISFFSRIERQVANGRDQTVDAERDN